MSSYFDEASLVMIPSGYKDQKVYSVKPLDGSGDLTFSRASSATRVASNGLIEKVRTNQLLQSNTFSTTWGSTEATLTSGQSGYDGTSNAWKITANTNNAAHYIFQNFTLSGQLTLSLYAKPSGYNFIMIYAGSYGGTFFDISNGTLGSTIGTAPTSSKIEAAGNGYYRCSITVPSAADMGIFVANSSSTYVFAGNGTNGVLIQAAQVEYGDIATDYIATTSAAVSVGPVSGLPRLDYLNSTCPRLLLEPQRTNLFTYSEQLNTGTSGATATPNQAVSPDGYTNADLVTGAGANNYIAKGVAGGAAGTFTFSIFLKAGTDSAVGLDIYDGAYYNATYNLSTGVASGTGASMVSYGSGWYRCILTRTTANTPSEVSVSSIGDGLTIYAWGGQFESGAYATSYIPTLGTSVTRSSDVCNKTSASALIGQTEGTLFAELSFPNLTTGSSSYFYFTDGSYNNSVVIGREPASPNPKYFFYIAAGGSVILNNAANNIQAGFAKLALAYKSGSWAAYLNGTLVASGTSTFTFGATMNRIGIGTNDASITIQGDSMIAKQAILFPTRLSNSDLAALTA